MDKTEQDLEWARIVGAVTARCAGPRGLRTVLPLAATFTETAQGLGETAEALSLLGEGEPLPLSGILDLSGSLDRLERQGALDGPGLREIASTVGAARRLRRFLAQHRTRTPLLHVRASTDPTLDALEDEIAAVVESDGTVSDGASEELRRLRTETANLRDRIVRRLDVLVQRHADILSDRFHTIREGRHVLPMRADAHERLPGIVHATSASGATVFVEPRSLIAQGNRLKMAQAEMEREEARVLAALSESVRDRIHDVRAACASLDHADLRMASARLARDLDCVIPELTDEPRIRLRAGRHPILCLEGGRVVPNDVDLASGQALVVSGPNAGGKTVALKMLGLASLMVRAGLAIPADEGSICGFFDPVLTDVGDDQSIAKNLSTFSAHVTNLARILAAARPGALVLLDELAGGTDPQEGAALACAVVDALCRRGAAVAVTTHYEPLKALAQTDDRLRNASVGFDVERLEPTFALALDVPGASSALAVAARFGIPEDVVETARRVLPEQTRTFDELVRRLEEQRRSLQIERVGVEEERRTLDAARAAVERELAALLARERATLSREGERLMAAVRRAREDIRRARQVLKQERLAADGLRDAHRAIESAAGTGQEVLGNAEERADDALPGEPVGETGLAAGDRLWVPRLRSEAEVVEPPSRGRVRVAAGAMKLWVAVEEVRRLPRVVAAAEGGPRPAPPESTGTRRARARDADNTVDVRGLRVDEALGMVEAFLDRLYGADEPAGYVIHGLGTGALRQAIQHWLGREPRYVRRIRSGDRDEGGDGVTVVELK